MSTLLGVPDGKIGTRTTDFTTNKIGGIPDWIIPGSKIPTCRSCSRVMSLAAQLYCPLEGSLYHRTLYIFSCHNKRCWGKSDSWTALRSQKLDGSLAAKTEKSEKTKASAAFDDWGVAADDWGVDADDWETEAECQRSNVNDGPDLGTNWRDTLVGPGAGMRGCSPETQISSDQSENRVLSTRETDLQGEMAQLNVHDFDDSDSEKSGSNIVMDTDSVTIKVTEESVEGMMSLLASKIKEDKGQGQSSSEESCHGNGPELVFEPYYISVFYESEAIEDNTFHIQELIRNYKIQEGEDLDMMPAEGKKGFKGGAENYEEDQVVHGDKYFYKFSKRMAVCPQQCIRYHWNGNPLYISQPDPKLTSVLRCNHCGDQTAYELQLLPTLVNFLRVHDKSDPATEFGTVIVYSCRGSCWKDTDITRSEVTYVQPDTDYNLFR
ncbi:programmed cell death protein 2-like [Argopecten irradians]|uniref:programmed cell death protein 2-like n=1 Tax=Argopecten irradians TaxID=31199 RepID=UPI00371A901B